MKNNDDVMPVSRFLKILAVVILIFGLMYFLTEKVVKKDTTTKKADNNYNETIVGSSLSLNETEYYVLFYDPNSDLANYLDSWQTSYITAKKEPKIYFVDLSKSINKKYETEDKSNPMATTESELKVKNGTLMVVENNKIINYLEDTTAIYNLLK